MTIWIKGALPAGVKAYGKTPMLLLSFFNEFAPIPLIFFGEIF